MNEPTEKAPAQPQGEAEEVAPEENPVNLFFEAMAYAVGVETVFGDPVTVGDRVIIPVAETGVGGGVGYYKPRDSEAGPGRMLNFSSGGGGGGASTRPIAAIVVSPEGVDIKPVFDLSKLALTGIANAAGIWQGLAAFAKAMRRRP